MSKLTGGDISLGPEMKSVGNVLGVGENWEEGKINSIGNKYFNKRKLFN